MKNISYYSKEAIDSRQNIAHHVENYKRYTEDGVIEIYYFINITKKYAFLSGAFIIPGLLYLGDQAFNDGKLCTSTQTHYFDASTGQEISYSQAQENKNKNKQANLLNNEGNELHKQGKYEEAYYKFSKAYSTCTSGYSEEIKFKSNRDIAKNNYDNAVARKNAQRKIDAENLNSEGCKLDSQNKHKEALRKFKEAADLTNDSNSKKIYIKNQSIELVKIADNLKNNGDCQAAVLKYDEAFKLNQDVTNFASKYTTICKKLIDLCKYQDAIKCCDKVIQLDSQNSIGYCNKGFALYLLGKHQEAINYYDKAIQIKSDFLCYTKKGNALKNLGKIKEAEECFNKAIFLMKKIKFDNDKYVENNNVMVLNKVEVQLVKELISYQVETENKIKNNEAEALNKQGLELLNQSKYDEATIKFSKAYEKCTNGYSNKQIFKSNKEKAQMEVEAQNFNNEGNKLFYESRYQEAIEKYSAACTKITTVSKEYLKYSANKSKATIELEAQELNNQANILFNQDNYKDALTKYQEAENKSKITKEKSIYTINKDKVQTIINRLSVLDTLWNEAWDAENDEENDRPEEVEKLFKKVLNKSRDTQKMFPDILKFKEYETLVSLKIEGNNFFNKFIELQQDGELQLDLVELLEEAKNKFKMGCKSDQRFESCIKFIEVQIEEAMQSMKIPQQHKMDQILNNLNIIIPEQHNTDHVFNNLIINNNLEHGDLYEHNITGDNTYNE